MYADCNYPEDICTRTGNPITVTPKPTTHGRPQNQYCVDITRRLFSCFYCNVTFASAMWCIIVTLKAMNNIYNHDIKKYT